MRHHIDITTSAEEVQKGIITLTGETQGESLKIGDIRTREGKGEIQGMNLAGETGEGSQEMGESIQRIQEGDHTNRLYEDNKDSASSSDEDINRSRSRMRRSEVKVNRKGGRR